MWRTPQGAYLALENGAERPSLAWLRGYVQNDAPWVQPGQTFLAPEGTAPGTVLGTVLASDGQGTAPHDFRIVRGNADGLFELDARSGVLALGAVALDHELARRHELEVVVRDDYTKSEPAAITIEVVNLNDSPPAVVAAQRLQIDERFGGAVGRVRATDADDLLEPGFSELGSFRIVGGSGAGVFRIHPWTGEVRMADPSGIDFSVESYSLDVTVADGLRRSLPARVIIAVPEIIRMCYRGHTLAIPRERAWRQLARGAGIGACEARPWR